MTKIAFVGCGGVQQIHYGHLSHMDGVKIAGHCDVDEARAREAADRYGGEPFTSYEAMYEKVKPQAVYIAVPPFAHTGMEEAAAQRGIHLFIEKPIALEANAARRTAAAIRKSRIITSVAYCFRYTDTVAQARQMLKCQAACLVSGRWHGGMPGVWWWRRMDKSGGQFLEQATHLVDLMRYLCGDVSEVFAVGSTGCMTKVEDFDVYDNTVASMRLKSGATAVITSTCVAEHDGRVALDIVTPESTLTFSEGKLIVREAGKRTEFSPKVDMYLEENRAFIEAVQTGKRNRIKSTYADALKTLLITCAANESIRTGLPVKP
jgi:myo-inositol 2-dehydrogenase / D-chiro-inositol 1-dehydrogenase